MAGTTEWTIGVKKIAAGQAWGSGTVPLLVALDGVLIESESMPDMIPDVISDANVGDSLKQGNFQGNRSGEGALVWPSRFEGVEKWIAWLFGDDTIDLTPGSETAGTAVSHTMIFQDSNSGIYAAVVMRKDPSGGADTGIWEWPFCKVSQLEFNHGNGKLMVTPTLIPNTVLRDAAATNGDTELDAATPPTRTLLTLFNQVTVLIKEVTGSEGNLVDPTDEIKVTNVQVTINRNLTGIPESGSEGEVGEPETDGLPEGSMVLSIADYGVGQIDDLIREAQTLQDGSEPKTYKVEVVWWGQEITGSDATTDGQDGAGKHDYKLLLQLPAVQLIPTAVNAGSPGARVSVDLNFDINTPSVAGNGTDWTWSVAGDLPIRAIVINENTVDEAA